MTWEELVRTLALLGFSSTVVGGAIGFVLKGVIENQFKQNLERFKIQFSKLHEMRASAIAELYGSIVDVEQALHDWIYKDMPVGVAPPAVDVGKASHKSVRCAYSRFALAFSCSKGLAKQLTLL